MPLKSEVQAAYEQLGLQFSGSASERVKGWLVARESVPAGRNFVCESEPPNLPDESYNRQVGQLSPNEEKVGR